MQKKVKKERKRHVNTNHFRISCKQADFEVLVELNKSRSMKQSEKRKEKEKKRKEKNEGIEFVSRFPITLRFSVASHEFVSLLRMNHSRTELIRRQV